MVCYPNNWLNIPMYNFLHYKTCYYILYIMYKIIYILNGINHKIIKL